MSKLQIQFQENDSDQWVPMMFTNEYTDSDVHDIARKYTSDVIISEAYVTRTRVLKPGRYVSGIGVTYWVEEASYERTDFTRDVEAIERAARLAAKYADLD